VRLSGTDWRQEPDVDFNLLSDHRDLARLTSGFRRIAALHDLPPLQAITSDPFPASFTDKIRQVGTYNTKNKILTRIGATLMDGPAFMRKFIMQGFIMESAGLVKALRDDAALEAYIKRAAVGVWHCSCSCRMGSEDDPMAVTDEQGRVRGVHGLRVVDASIFPVVPCANTNIPTMMVAEKIADAMLQETRHVA
jgi:5-(hydroxymethyl)furfural/furfural oxidase